MIMFCMDDMVPQNHMLRLIDKAIDWDFIYDLVEEKYCLANGRPSMDPVMLIKIPFIQYLYGIKSMRQTIREIEVNVAYRWFLGLDMMDPVPHFSTFGKNYTRRFKDTDLFEQIFAKILEDCMKFNLVDTEQIFVDSTHVKACANSKKMRKRVAHEQALWYEEELQKEITKDREAHGKKPLKEKDRNDPPSGGGGRADSQEEIAEGAKTQKCSTTDPESGWFRKGEHKHVFAYAVETACDKHGWILGYSVHPGNEHDSRTFKPLYDKIKNYRPAMIVADAGYRTPAIAHELLEDGIEPLFPYKSPMTKDGFFRKYEYVYDEGYDCCLCPENQILSYRTTNRDGYREYQSCPEVCAKCPSIHKCTESKNHVKVIMRHVWEEYMEMAEDIRHTLGNKEIYELRKETIERIFGTAKEQHGFRYTQYIGKARMEMKAGLTFACMNLKKLARILENRASKTPEFFGFLRFLVEESLYVEKWCWKQSQHQLCLQSEAGAKAPASSTFLLLFLYQFCFHDIPQRTGDAYGRISSAGNTYHQRQCELFHGSNSHNIENRYHDKGGQGSENTSGQCLGNTVVYHILQRIFPFHLCQVLTDTVKNNDGCIDGITDNGQHAGNEGISYRDSGCSVKYKYYQNIMQQCSNCTGCKSYILEPDPDIDQHKDRCDDHGNNRIMFYFLADGSADVLCSDCCIAQIKCLRQLLVQFRTFVKIQLFCLDNHLRGSCHLLGLNIIVSGNF